MEPLAVVGLLDEASDAGAGIASIAIGAAVDLLLLERFHEALGLGVVVGIADPAHARLDIVIAQDLRVIAAGILHTPVRVMDEAAGDRPARRDRHIECRDRQLCPQMRLEHPAYDLAAEGIEHDGEIAELLGKMHVR